MKFKLPKASRRNDEPFHVTGPARVAILPDIHIPFHDEAALEIALTHIHGWRPTHILLNGDTGDFYASSDFDRDPARRHLLGEEMEQVTEFLVTLKKEFPKSKVIYKCGNHDDRIRRYIWGNAPELAGIPTCTLQSFLKLDQLGIPFVPSSARIKLGALTVIHGHEYKTKYSGGLVNPATTLFRKAKCLILCSHHHQSNRHSERTADGKLMTAWTTGCLCDLNPDWNPLNNWSHGFATVTISADGDFDCQNMRIIGKKVYA